MRGKNMILQCKTKFSILQEISIIFLDIPCLIRVWVLLMILGCWLNIVIKTNGVFCWCFIGGHLKNKKCGWGMLVHFSWGMLARYTNMPHAIPTCPTGVGHVGKAWGILDRDLLFSFTCKNSTAMPWYD